MMVRNPFIDTKAEHESEPVLWFSSRSRRISQRGKSTFVNGTRGSGKTSILRSLSARYISEISSLNDQLSGQRLNWFGIYVRLQDVITDVLISKNEEKEDVALREHNQEIRFAVFSQYIELLLVAAICDDLADLRDSSFIRFSAGSEYDALCRLLADIPELKAYAKGAPLETFRDLSSVCRRTLNQLFSSAVQTQGRIPSGVFLPTIPGSLLRAAASYLVGVVRGDRFQAASKLKIKFLIDDCEVLPLEHQVFLNTIVRNSNTPISWVIAYVGSLYEPRLTIRSSQMLSETDREIESLDEVSEGEFRTLCQRIASLRLYRALSPEARKKANLGSPDDCFNLRKRLGLFSLNRLIGETFRNSISSEFDSFRQHALSWSNLLLEAKLDGNEAQSFELVDSEFAYTVAITAERLGISLEEGAIQLMGDRSRKVLERRIARKQRAAFLYIGRQFKTDLLLAGERVVIALSDSCIRDFLDIMRELYERSVSKSSEGALIQFCKSELPIPIAKQSAAIYAASHSKFRGITTISDPYGQGVSRFIETLGMLTKELQAGDNGIQNPEIGIFRVHWSNLTSALQSMGGSVEALEDLFRRAEIDGFVREVDTNDRLVLRPNPRMSEQRLFRLHRRFAPFFGFSWRGPYAEFPLSERAMLEIATNLIQVSQADWVRRTVGRVDVAPGQLTLPTMDVDLK